MDPAAEVDANDAGDASGRAPVGVDEGDGREPASVAAKVREKIGCEYEVLPGGTHQPLVSGEGGGLSTPVCQGESADGSLPGAAGK